MKHYKENFNKTSIQMDLIKILKKLSIPSMQPHSLDMTKKLDYVFFWQLK